MKRQHLSPLVIALCLYLLLFSIYLLIYSGLFYSFDGMSRFSVTESLAKRGAFDIPQVWGLSNHHSFGLDGEYYSKYGIFPSLLAVPLYWIALHIKQLGLVQTVMLLNAFITAATGSLIFLYVKGLGYSRHASLLVALVFGFCTTAFVYAKYFYSEPIASLCFLTTAYVLFKRKGSSNGNEGSSGYALLAGLTLGLAIASKPDAALAIPIFFFYGFYRHISKATTHTREYLIDILFFGLSLGVSLAAIGAYNYARFGSPLQTGYPGWETFDNPLLTGLWGLLLSPEKGLVFYSPVLLLSFFSFFAFFKRNRAEAMLTLALFVVYCITFAKWHAWEGGWVSWGPRFLVPLIPFLMITTAPTIEALLAQRFSLATLAFLALCLFSAIVQILGAGVNAMSVNVQLTSIQRVPFDPQRWRVLGQALFFRLQNLDFAWARTVDGQTHFDAVAVSATVALVLFSIATLVYFSRHEASQRAFVMLLASSLFLPIALSWFCLNRYYDEPFFPGGNDYHALLDYLHQASKPEDVLVLDTPLYTKFFLNYNKTLPKWYTLHGDEFPLEARKSALLDRLLDRYPRIWLVDDSVPSLGLPRPIERYLSERSYKINEVTFSNYSRLCLYSTAHRPDPNSPQFATELNLGHNISLLGYDLFPSTTDTLLHSGDAIHLSLLWQAIAPIERDYTVFVQMLGENGQLGLQMDRYPVDGFHPTSSWQMGEKVRDNYGLVIPPEVSLGQYRLIAGLYWLETLERLPVTNYEVVHIGDYVLLGEVTVAP